MNAGIDPGSYKKYFSPGAGRRVIIIESVDAVDWQALVDYLKRTDADLQYREAGELRVLPDDMHEVLGQVERSPELIIRLAGVAVVCAIQDTKNIMLEFELEDIDDELKAMIMMRLMSTSGRRLNKRVRLASKDPKVHTLLVYEPGLGML